MAELSEVFGVSNKPVLSYIQRNGIDDKLLTSWNESKHIVVYGASKQGKTSLITHHFDSDDYLKVLCGQSFRREEIYAHVLEQAGVELLEAKTRDARTGGEVSAEGEIGGGLANVLAGLRGKFGSKGTHERGRSETTKPIPTNLSSPQSVHKVLDAAGMAEKRIILENFHYLPTETQKQMAVDLRVWNDLDVTFVILGIWKDTNYLQTYNPELNDRAVEIPVEPWLREHFVSVVKEGQKHLDVQVSSAVVEAFAREANGSIGVFQELIKLYFASQGVARTADGRGRQLTDLSPVGTILREKANAYDTSYRQFLWALSHSNKSGRTNPLFIKYYLCHFLLDTNIDRLQQGVPKTEFVDYVEEKCHREVKRDVLNNQVSTLLPRLAKAQADLKFPWPIVQAVGQNLKVIDPIFAFYVKHGDISSLRQYLTFPGNVVQASIPDEDTG